MIDLYTNPAQQKLIKYGEKKIKNNEFAPLTAVAVAASIATHQFRLDFFLNQI